MKKIAVMFGLFLLVAAIVFPVVGSGNYSPSNCSVEQNVGAFIADGSPRPPYPPLIIADGSPRPPYPPIIVADGSPRPPCPPVIVADGSPRPPYPPVVVA
jgi:hypothetical protein